MNKRTSSILLLASLSVVLLVAACYPPATPAPVTSSSTITNIV